MATLTVVNIARLTQTLATLVAAAVAGDEFPNDGSTFVMLKNDSVGSITVTAAQVAATDSNTPGTKTVAVPAGATVLWGPFPPSVYNNPTTGRVALTYSGVTTFTVNPFRLTPALP